MYPRSALFLPAALVAAFVALSSLPARSETAGNAPGGKAANTASKPAANAAHSHERASRHGGSVAMTKEHHFETVFAADGVRIYLYSKDQAPLELAKAAGTVTLRFKDGTKQEVALAPEMPVKGEATVYFCPMHPEVVQMEPGKCEKCGGMKLYTQNRLFAKADLSGVAPGSLQVVAALSGLGGAEPQATFVETFQGLAPAAKPAADPHAGHNH